MNTQTKIEYINKMRLESWKYDCKLKLRFSLFVFDALVYF